MRVVDAVAVILLIGAAMAFWFGQSALAKAEDLRALYWLIVGALCLRAAVVAVRPKVLT